MRSADFERVLGTPAHARSPHFAVHYLRSGPSSARKPGRAMVDPKLSTGQAPEVGKPVDESPAGCWLGAVVPKRHARRSVTRNLLKRQIREAAGAEPRLQAGLWVVRLRSPFDRERFTSAASEALRDEAGRELSRLMADAVRQAAAA
ncbi:ribonuclease P protein component [Piscinibacter sp. HJYY11]|nr:ribonuclease P protein component [Piscinibacter sp. HJYY11]